MMKIKLQELFTILMIAVMMLSFVYIDEVKDGIVNSIENCILNIVPSLFLNSVLSGVLIKCSGILKPKRVSHANY